MTEMNEKKKQKSGNLSWYKYILIIIGIFLFIFIIKKIFFEKKNYDHQTKALPCEYDETPDPLNPNTTYWVLPKNIEEKILQNIKNS